MSKTIKQFAYRVVQMGKSDDLPFSPHVEMVLDNWMTSEGESAPIVSADLMTESEIDCHAKALIEDIQAWAKGAKAALRKAKADTTAILEARRQPPR
jgi:hypothetical protein